MSQGTLKLVNGSKAVVGTGTNFVNDLTAADFIVITVGGVTYSLVVASVQSPTGLTLLENFDGPSVDGAAWTAVPYGAQMRITQQLGTDISRLMRYYLLDKNNWNAVLTGPDDVTVTLPDGTQFTGPSWPKVVASVAAGYKSNGTIPAGVDLNTLGPDSFGIWVQTVNANATAELHYPETVGGTLEVLPHRQGAMQRYTSQTGTIYVRTASGAWDGASGPWSTWGASSKTLEDALNAGYAKILIKQMKSGNFWVDVHPDARIHRINDRVFMGAAADNDGKVTSANNSTNKDWLEVIRQYTTNNSQLAVLSTIGQTAVLGGSRSSDSASAGSMGCIGLHGWAINDNSTQKQTVYGAYLEVRRGVNTGNAHGFELDMVNYGNAVPINPYDMFPEGLTTGAWIASGGEVPVTKASAALAILNNSATWDKGIVFHAKGLEGCDGVSGTGIAIEMAKGHALRWMFTGGKQGASLSSDVSNAAAAASILYSDIGILFRNASSKNMLRVVMNQTNVNGLNIVPGDTGTGPTIYADGDDANVDLRLSAKGGGAIDLRGMTVTGNAGSSFGYISVKINGTSLKLQLFNP